MQNTGRGIGEPGDGRVAVELRDFFWDSVAVQRRDGKIMPIPALKATCEHATSVVL